VAVSEEFVVISLAVIVISFIVIVRESGRSSNRRVIGEYWMLRFRGA